MSETALRIGGDSNKSLPKKLTLTVMNINRAACPPGKDRITIYDSRVPGLALRVTSKGGKSFVLYRKVNGRPLKMKLGGFPHITIEQARTLAGRHNGSIADGKDPRDARRAINESMTLAELFEDYKRLKLANSSHKTKANEQSLFNTCFADWKNRKVVTILPVQINERHAHVGRTRGPIVANRAIELLRRMYNWKAIEPNAVAFARVKFNPETERERFLQADELPRFYAAVEAEPNATFRDFIKLALWTGARRSNVQSMRWAEVNLDSATWTIPAEKSKSGKAMLIHLSAEALQILKARKGQRGEFVFPSHGRTGHIADPKKAWKRILAAAKIADLHIHDLRRTLGSWQAAAGASLQVIGKSLGHTSLSATAIYARLNLDPVRESVNVATAAIRAAVSPKPPAKRSKAKKEVKARKK